MKAQDAPCNASLQAVGCVAQSIFNYWKLTTAVVTASAPPVLVLVVDIGTDCNALSCLFEIQEFRFRLRAGWISIVYRIICWMNKRSWFKWLQNLNLLKRSNHNWFKQLILRIFKIDVIWFSNRKFKCAPISSVWMLRFHFIRLLRLSRFHRYLSRNYLNHYQKISILPIQHIPSWFKFQLIWASTLQF